MNYKITEKYKDRVFRIVFREKKELLELYNAVNNSSYSDPSALEIITIEDVLYMSMKNDSSFIIDGITNLYENQSTYTPNFPLQGLFYFSALCRKYIEPVKYKTYTNSPLMIPFPQYMVFYIGTQQEPEYQERKLSDLYLKNEDTKDLSHAPECTAIVLNINYGQNKLLMERCRTLEEYSHFIAIVRECAKSEPAFSIAVRRAVDYCIKHNILSDILLKNEAEIIDALLTKYNEEQYLKFITDDAFEQGFLEGKELGRLNGEKLGQITSEVLFIRKKLNEGIYLTDIADLLEKDVLAVAAIIRLIQKKPDADDETIAKQLLDTTQEQLL